MRKHTIDREGASIVGGREGTEVGQWESVDNWGECGESIYLERNKEEE